MRPAGRRAERESGGVDRIPEVGNTRRRRGETRRGPGAIGARTLSSRNWNSPGTPPDRRGCSGVSDLPSTGSRKRRPFGVDRRPTKRRASGAYPAHRQVLGETHQTGSVLRAPSWSQCVRTHLRSRVRFRGRSSLVRVRSAALRTAYATFPVGARVWLTNSRAIRGRKGPFVRAGEPQSNRQLFPSERPWYSTTTGRGIAVDSLLLASSHG